MSAWAPKRFWKQADVIGVEGGFTVLLDGKPVKTPAKTTFMVPTIALADAVAAEWQAQEGKVKPETMPFTRTANSALDKVTPNFVAVAQMLAAYGGSDLLCYRAPAPQELTARQAAVWDPLLVWIEGAMGASLATTLGVMPIEQPPSALGKLEQEVLSFTPFQLAAFHDLVAISGSLVIGLAIANKRITAEEGFDLSRVDEAWQVEQWGSDEESVETEATKRAGLLHAARFFELCG